MPASLPTYRSMNPAPLRPRTLSRRQFLHASLACAGTAALGLGGCTPQPPPLRIGTNLWLGYEFMFLARDQHMLDTARVRLVELLSASDCLQALSAGTLEGAGLTLDEVLSARAEGLDLQVVMVFNTSDGADRVLARREISGPRDLIGRRVGVEQSAVGALMLAAMLNEHGMHKRDIEVVRLTSDEHYRAFADDALDAVITFEPHATRLLRDGAHVIFDSRMLPGMVLDVLAVTRASLQARQQDICHLVDAHYAGLARYHADPLGTAQLLSLRQGLTPGELMDSLTGLQLLDREDNRRLFSGDARPLRDTALALHRIMVDNGLLGSGQHTDAQALLQGLFDARCLTGTGG